MALLSGDMDNIVSIFVMEMEVSNHLCKAETLSSSSLIDEFGEFLLVAGFHGSHDALDLLRVELARGGHVTQELVAWHGDDWVWARLGVRVWFQGWRAPQVASLRRCDDDVF
jgi:hypothetical protein